MKKRRPYRNATEAIIDMHERGFSDDFELSGDGILWIQRKTFLEAGEFVVVESHRFYVAAEQGISIVVHGVATFYLGIKGILIIRSHIVEYEHQSCVLIRKEAPHCCSE